MENITLADLYGIDAIEAAKMAYHNYSGAHLSVKLSRSGVQLTLSDTPRKPIMLPIHKPSRLERAKRSINVKVRKAK